jgi:hypothetical protein
MPVTTENSLIAAAGVLTLLGGVVAFRAKATLPFKLAYAATWPLLGSAAILLLQPSTSDFAATLTPAERARLAQVRENNRLSMVALKRENDRKD